MNNTLSYNILLMPRWNGIRLLKMTVQIFIWCGKVLMVHKEYKTWNTDYKTIFLFFSKVRPLFGHLF